MSRGVIHWSMSFPKGFCPLTFCLHQKKNPDTEKNIYVKGKNPHAFFIINMFHPI